ncbi:MAG: hypothetical protein LBK60_00490 [Verrucomicrobiales bacterium]|jgi:hypothetical protein|nr:hypothetical protein [Verrucomicrobiales bacterium]
MSFLFGNTKNQTNVNTSVAGVDNDDVNTNDEAVPVPYLAGRTKVALRWITPAYRWKATEVKVKTGKSSSSTVGYNYYADLAGIVGLGVVDNLFKVWFDDEVVWEGNLARGETAGVNEFADFTIANYGMARIYWGSDTQPVDDLVLTPSGPAPTYAGFDPRDVSTWPNKGKGEMYDTHPAYRGQCYIVFKQLYFGAQDRTATPNIAVEIAREPDYFGGANATMTNDGVSGSLILFEALTNPRFGMAVDPLTLDEASFESVRQYQEANNFRLSPAVTSATSFREFAAKVLEYYDGFLRLNNGKMEHGAFRRGAVDTSNLPRIADADLTDEPTIVSDGWKNTVNQVGVIYREITRAHKDDIQKYRDADNYQRTGEIKAENVQRPWINNAAAAMRYAVEYGKMAALPKQTGSLTVMSASAETLLPGGLFWLQLARFGVQMVCRCVSVTAPNDNGNTVKIEWESERGLWPSLYVPPPALGLGNFKVSPDPLEFARIVELPEAFKDRANIAVFPLAERNDALFIGFRVWFSVNGDSYDLIADSETFAVRGIVSASLAAGAGTVDVKMTGLDADTIDSVSAAGQADDELLGFVDGEIVSVGAVTPLGDNTYRLAIARARLASSAQAHAAAAVVWLVPRAKITAIYNENFITAQTRQFKLQPVTSGGEVDLSVCPVISYNFTGNGLGQVTGLTLATGTIFQTDGTLQSRITATWNTINSPLIASYETALQQSGVSAVDYQNTSGNQIQWTVIPNQTYTVKVRAIDIYGNTYAWSATVSVTSARDTTAPGYPSNWSVTGSIRAFNIKWTKPDDIDYAGTEVYMSANSDMSSATRVAVVGGESTTVSGIAASTTRYFRLRAFDTSGNFSGYTSIVSATTPTAVTSDLAAGAVNSATLFEVVTGTAARGEAHDVTISASATMPAMQLPALVIHLIRLAPAHPSVNVFLVFMVFVPCSLDLRLLRGRGDLRFPPEERRHCRRDLPQPSHLTNSAAPCSAPSAMAGLARRWRHGQRRPRRNGCPLGCRWRRYF